VQGGGGGGWRLIAQTNPRKIITIAAEMLCTREQHMSVLDHTCYGQRG